MRIGLSLYTIVQPSPEALLSWGAAAWPRLVRVGAWADAHKKHLERDAQFHLYAQDEAPHTQERES